jgi:hypothetical protein
MKSTSMSSSSSSNSKSKRIPQLQPATDLQMECLLNGCPIIERMRVAPDTSADPNELDFLFKEGKACLE